MKVLVTGSKGFIGKNLMVRLNELTSYKTLGFDRGDSAHSLAARIDEADAIVHLAGISRPGNDNEFSQGNGALTSEICNLINKSGRHIPLLLSSSIQAKLDNPYGTSKRDAETSAEHLAETTDNPVTIYRLPNVFGKWCKPNYNSVVATFCHNLANEKPITLHDPTATLQLIYVDDLITEFLRVLSQPPRGLYRPNVSPSYQITVGELAATIESFKNCRKTLVTEHVGSGLTRALYATYISYLPPIKFTYDLTKHADKRGVFVEMLKTQDSGQFSYFTAHPGVTRGGHYHHSKTEKFLVAKGHARFRFRHILTDEEYELVVEGGNPQVVETVPGWIHNITNIGNEEMLVMLWANEVFDPAHPDTITAKV